MRKRLREKLAEYQRPKRIIKRSLVREQAQYEINKFTSDLLESIILPVRMVNKEEYQRMYPDNG